MTQAEQTTSAGVRAGTLLQGGWVVEAALRAGPTGIEFRCHRQDDTTRRAIVKVFQDTYPEAWPRFQREAHVLKRIQHPHLVHADTAQLRADPPYMVLQLREGPDLRTVLAHTGPMPALQALAVARDLANLLAHLHAQAIYHRDLRPQNVLLTPQGPLVVQLGVAPDEGFGRLTNPGTRLGDIQYAPPEWASPELLRPQQWDLYALGLTMMAMLTGEEPFALDPSLPEPDRSVRLTKRKRATPFLDPGPGFSEAVRTVVRTLSDVDPARRPDSARQVAQQLQQIVADLSGEADLPSGPAPTLPALLETPPSLEAPLRAKPPPPTIVPADVRPPEGQVMMIPTEPGDAPRLLARLRGGPHVHVGPYVMVGIVAAATFLGATVSMLAVLAFLWFT